MEPGALQTELLEVPFKKGVDTKTNAKLVLPGQLIKLLNGTFLERSTIKKRNGYQALSRDVLGSTRLSSAEALATFDNELLLLSSGSLYSWSPGLAKWVGKGALAPMTAKCRQVMRNTYNQSTPDSATVNGITLYAWVDGRGGLRATVLEDATGEVLIADTLIDASGVRPRCIAIQQNLVLVYQSAANIFGRYVDSTSPTAFSNAATLGTDGNGTAANQHLDVCVSPYGTGQGTGLGGAFFAYNSSTATTTKLGYVRADGSLGQSSNGFPNIVSIAAASDKSLTLIPRPGTPEVWVVYSNATNCSFTARYGDLTQKVAITVVEALTNVENVTGAFDSSDALKVFYEVQAALTYNRFVKLALISNTGAVGALSVFKRGVALAFKAFLQATTGVYVGLVHDASPSSTTYGLQNTYFVVKVDGTIVGRLQPSTADRIQVGQIPAVRISIDGAKVSTCLPVRTQFVTAGNVQYSLVGLANEILTFGAAAYRNAQLGESLLIAGGILGCYDSQGVVENGFFLYPENVSVAQTASGGSMSNGTYNFILVWEWQDAMGQMHRSAGSVPIQVVVNGGGTAQRVTLTVPTLRLTAKTGARTAPQLVCYSTVASGTLYYKTPNLAATDPVASPVYNDPTVDTITFERQAADATIALNQLVYTQGGILNNIVPPAATGVVTTKNRAFLFGLEDVRRIWYSKFYQRTEGVAFQDTFFIDVDPSGGEVVACAVMDEKLIIFKTNQIEMVQGDGPDDAGQNSTLTNPVVVTTDVGLADARSIAATTNGLVFKSAKGIYLLTRALEAIYVGDRVEAYNGSHVLAATLVPDKSQVRFLLDDGKTALMWDYFFNEWAVWTNHGGLDSTVWLGGSNAYAYLRATNGEVYLEAPGVFTDNGVDIHMLSRLAWLRRSSLQGWMRVRRASFLGDYYSPHTLAIRIAYDYQDFFTELKVWQPANVIVSGQTFGSDSPFGQGSPFGGAISSQDGVNQWQIHLPRQKCEAIMFEVEDVGSSPGQAYSLSGLLLEVAMLPGSARLSAAKSM